MKIITLNGSKIAPNTIAAIGFFDGVHNAHRALIETMQKEAKQRTLNPAVITFNVHPKSVVLGIPYHYITPIERKIEKIKAMGVETLYLIEFTKDKAKLEPEAFIDYYLKGLNVLVCGFDFHFGNRALGNIETLKSYAPFNTLVVEELKYRGVKIGSTKIRDQIKNGQVDKIRPTLGEYYSLEAQVIDGQKKGRAIGYPTANLDVGDYLVPRSGVYATFTKVRGTWYKSVSTVGYNPTLSDKAALSVETHIFDFDEMIYGEMIDVAYIKRIRKEITFESVEALIKQIEADVRDVQQILKNTEFDLSL